VAGIIPYYGACAAASAGGGGDVLTLSGEVLFAFNFMADAFAEFKLDNDGNMYDRENNGAYNLIDSGTDWVRPAISSPGLYQARYTNLTGTALSFNSASEDTWRAMTLGDFRTQQRTFGGPISFESSTFDYEVRLGAGAVLASGSYTLNADREDF
jgi:hypothetical protein